jgi:HlyD family secretion protein
VTNPVTGVVLTVVSYAGEMVAAGSPIYTIADLDTLDLKAYATGDQLPRLRLGQMVDVLFDGENGELKRTRGQLSWISDRAQFTPTPIQTRENRADLVYAFEVRVPNPDGLLKIGMPGEVRFAPESYSSE